MRSAERRSDSGTGTVSVTYAAPTLGPTAQVIFDVTGYYVASGACNPATSQPPYTFPRCWAGNSPKRIDLPFQGAVCLSPGFRDCVLYRQQEKSRGASES
jgi:hypothetical protein